MAGLGDLSFDFSGYSAALMSCALQSTYLILVERSGTEKGELYSLPLVRRECCFKVVEEIKWVTQSIDDSGVDCELKLTNQFSSCELQDSTQWSCCSIMECSLCLSSLLLLWQQERYGTLWRASSTNLRRMPCSCLSSFPHS